MGVRWRWNRKVVFIVASLMTKDVKGCLKMLFVLLCFFFWELFISLSHLLIDSFGLGCLFLQLFIYSRSTSCLKYDWQRFFSPSVSPLCCKFSLFCRNFSWNFYVVPSVNLQEVFFCFIRILPRKFLLFWYLKVYFLWFFLFLAILAFKFDWFWTDLLWSLI